jgi:hypothetical protein
MKVIDWVIDGILAVLIACVASFMDLDDESSDPRR